MRWRFRVPLPSGALRNLCYCTWGSGMSDLRLQVCMLIALFACAMPVCALGAEQTAERKAGQKTALTAASQTPPLKITLTRQKITTIDGRETTAPADFAKPGDILEDTATYANVSNAPLKITEATLPVPANTVLQIRSLKPAGATASLDGRSFETLPIRRKSATPGASPTETEVDAGAYRFVRWSPGEIGPGKAVAFSARFRVIGEIVVPGTGKD